MEELLSLEILNKTTKLVLPPMLKLGTVRKYVEVNRGCQSVSEFRDNFHTMHGQAPLSNHCDLQIDSQELSLSCGKVMENMTTTELLDLNSMRYEDNFGNEEQHLKITKVFQRILRVRKALSVRAAGLPGLHNSVPG